MTDQLTDGAQPKGPGRPKAQINVEVVKALAAIGCPVEEIADEVGVNKKTLERRFSKDIEKGRLKRNRSLRRKQFELAMKGDRTMLVWLGKVLLGQSEKIQHTGEDGGPIKHEHAVATMTNEQLDKEIEKLIGPISGTKDPSGGSDSGAPAAP
jgi:predicted transcriptional regulator